MDIILPGWLFDPTRSDGNVAEALSEDLHYSLTYVKHEEAPKVKRSFSSEDINEGPVKYAPDSKRLTFHSEMHARRELLPRPDFTHLLGMMCTA